MSLFAKLQEDAIIPTRATTHSAGYDLHTTVDVIIKPNDWLAGPVIVPTGVTCMPPVGYHGQIWAKSGKAKLGILKLAGVIDGDYAPNEIMVLLTNLGDSEVVFNKGDKIAQIIFVPYYSEEDVSAVRVGGFGSTDTLTQRVSPPVSIESMLTQPSI